MNKYYYFIILLLSFSVLSAQEKLSKEEKERREKNIQAGNPFAQFGYKAKIATLSKGKYLEFHDLDSIVTIGTVRWHVYKNKIIGHLVQDSLNLDSQPIGDRTGRWISPDPLSEEFPSWSPYTMCFDNPIKYKDPDGRAAYSPIYNTNGTFLGTDDKGLQGKAIVMQDKNFKQNMSHDEALKNNLGAEGLKDDTAKASLVSNFNSLPSRPDYDGKVTLSEANDWFKNGNGQPLFMDLGKIDLSGISSSRFKGVGSKEAFNLLLNSNSIDAGVVLGNVTLRLHPDNKVKGFPDKYDFESHSWLNPLNWPRNVETIIGRNVAGEGNKYPIYLYGSQTIKPIYLPNK